MIPYKRWLHSLQPNVKKSAWTADEDKLLIELYLKHGPKWSAIARQILGRTDDACSKRYREALDPNLKKEDWTPEEDAKLIEVYHLIGGKWGQVGQSLQRSGLGCRNRSIKRHHHCFYLSFLSRWRLLERKKASNAHQISYPQESLAVPVSPAQLHQSPVPVYEHLENDHSPMSEWPPYYPPEAYPTFPQEDGLHLERPFRELTPEVLDIADPNIAPFQFSSSSLSAALSDPPRPAPALPPVSIVNTPDLVPPASLNDYERQPSLSPLSQCDGIPEVNDILMSFDNLSNQPMDQHGMEISIPSISYEPDHMDNMGFNTADYASYFSASPISISPDITRVSDASQSLWKPRNMCEIELDNSPFSVFGLLHDGHDSSSTASTPYISSPLSLTSSPYPLSVVDLPVGEQPSSNSLLFSPPIEPHANLAPRPKKATSVRKRCKASLKAASASRLSSTLSLLWNEFDTLPFVIQLCRVLTLFFSSSIRPYACGHDGCWPTREFCFATSGELVEHIKEQHPECHSTGKPYRCALSGCDKSWKVSDYFKNLSDEMILNQSKY